MGNKFYFFLVKLYKDKPRDCIAYLVTSWGQSAWKTNQDRPKFHWDVEKHADNIYKDLDQVRSSVICIFQLRVVWFNNYPTFRSDQIRSVTQSCPTFCDPMNRSTPGLPVHHQLPEFTEGHVHQVSDAIQPSHPLSSPSPLAPNPSQHHSLFQWVNSLHEVAKVLEFQL